MGTVFEASTPPLQHPEEIQEEKGDEGIFGIGEDHFRHEDLGKLVD